MPRSRGLLASLTLPLAAALVVGGSSVPSAGLRPAAAVSAPAAPVAADAVNNSVVTTDVWGARVDAHDGTVVQDADGTLFAVGTSYICGFQLNVDSAWCGVRAYSSTDLSTWTPVGAVGGIYTHDHIGPTVVCRNNVCRLTASPWQARCNGAAFGCFRPHIAHRPTADWVMWINTPSTAAGYTVLVSPTAGGPYREITPPTLAVHDGSTRLSGGDLDLITDDDGQAWVAYVTIGPSNTPADIVVERLNDSWTSGTGQFTRLGRPMVEAPGVFQRGSSWYMVFSDPAAPFGITGASYATAPDPLGPWTIRGRISDTSCQGQTADVNVLRGTDGTVRYVWQVDRWAQASGTFRRNQFLANTYYAPLVFNTDGTIPMQSCVASWTF